METRFMEQQEQLQRETEEEELDRLERERIVKLASLEEEQEYLSVLTDFEKGLRNTPEGCRDILTRLEKDPAMAKHAERARRNLAAMGVPMPDPQNVPVDGMVGALKDSGLRETFITGGVREPRGQGKGRFDLIPWYCITRLAKHYEAGAKKYKDRNWEKGLPLSNFVDSGTRHLIQFITGDRSEDHLAAVLWNFVGLMWTEEQIRLGKLPDVLNDLPEVQIASMAQAVAAIERQREKLPSELVEQIQAKPTGDSPARVAIVDDVDQGYSQEVKDAVKAKLGHWADHAPFTDLAEMYLTKRAEFDALPTLGETLRKNGIDPASVKVEYEAVAARSEKAKRVLSIDEHLR